MSWVAFPVDVNLSREELYTTANVLVQTKGVRIAFLLQTEKAQTKTIPF